MTPDTETMSSDYLVKSLAEATGLAPSADPDTTAGLAAFEIDRKLANAIVDLVGILVSEGQETSGRIDPGPCER